MAERTMMPDVSAFTDIDTEELVGRARGMREAIQADAIEAEQRGTYSPELHQAFLDAGFYSILQPQKYGGLELGLVAQHRTILELARADAGIAWCLALGTHHTLPLVAHYPEQTAAWAFRDGAVISPHSLQKSGTASPVEGGYRVSVRSGYNSGAPYSTHSMLNARIDSGPREGEVIVCLIPREDYTILDDWGGRRTMALGATGSNTIEVSNAFVPSERTAIWNWLDSAFADGTPGYRSTGNPLYLGNVNAVYSGSLAALMLGAAYSALDAFEELLATKPRQTAPIVLRAEHRDGLRQYAQVRRLLDSAQAVLISTGRDYEHLNRAAAAGESVSATDHYSLGNRVYSVIDMAWQAAELMFHSSSSGVARTGHPIQRALLAIQMQRPQAYDNMEFFGFEFARRHFGVSFPEVEQASIGSSSGA